MNLGRCIYVYGRVQGVGFRYQTYRWANKMGLTGSVRNMKDGSVNIIAFGDDNQINALKMWLEQGGPAGSRIDNIFIKECEYQSVADFNIRHD